MGVPIGWEVRARHQGGGQGAPSEKMRIEQKLEGKERVSSGDMWERSSIPGRGNEMSKGHQPRGLPSRSFNLLSETGWERSLKIRREGRVSLTCKKIAK